MKIAIIVTGSFDLDVDYGLSDAWTGKSAGLYF